MNVVPLDHLKKNFAKSLQIFLSKRSDPDPVELFRRQIQPRSGQKALDPDLQHWLKPCQLIPYIFSKLKLDSFNTTNVGQRPILILTHPAANAKCESGRMLWSAQRDGEYKQRPYTFGDFVTSRTEGSMQDVSIARLQSTRVQTPLSPPLLNVMYCVRVSLWTSFADPDPGSGAFLTPGSGIRNRFFPSLGSRIPSPYFWELGYNYLGKKFYNSLKMGQKIFLQHFKNSMKYNFVKFMATKKGMTTNFFRPSLLLLFWIRNTAVDSQSIPCATLKRRGSWVISVSAGVKTK